jgi:outer membrane receptor protein involved in Fe transport
VTTSKTALKACLLAAVSLSPFAAASAFAADVDGAAPTTQVTEVVVTVQKRSQSQLTVPITLNVVSGKFIEKMDIQDIHDLSAYTPGFYVQNQSVNDPGLVMRGITDDSTDSTDEPRVSVYQDGVSISRVSAVVTELFDEERIEVAKGPQTTLFGRSALTGAVSIIQNKATEAGFDWFAKAEGGNYNYQAFEGMVNVPLGDHFAIRIAGREKHRDGYIDNVLGGPALNGADAVAGRFALNYRNGDFNNDLIYNAEYDNPSAVSFKNKSFDPANPTTGAVLGDTSPWSAAALNGSPAIYGGRQLGIRRRVEGVTDIATYKINDAFKLTNTAAWRHDRSVEVFDPDGFGFPLLTAGDAESGQQFSEELRLNFDNGGKFSGFLGGSFFGSNARNSTPLAFDERTTLALLTGVLNRTSPVTGPVAAYTNPLLLAGELQGLLASYGLSTSPTTLAGLAGNLQPAHFEQYTTYGGTTSFDFYADGTWKPIAKLEISAGIRYTHDDKTSKFSSFETDRSVLGGVLAAGQIAQAYHFNAASTGNCNIPQVFAANPACQLLAGLATPGAASLAIPANLLPDFALQAQPTTGNGGKQSASLSDSGLSWRLNARYALTPTQSLYVTYARGRRPEVLAALAPSLPYGASAFSASAGQARFLPEAAETMDNYEAGYKSLLFDRKLSFNAAIYLNKYEHFSSTVLQNAQFITVDAGQANTYGFEGQVNWAATSNIDVYGVYAYTHGRFGNGLLNGNHFRLTPDHSLSAGASFRQHAFGGTFDFVPSVQWKSKYFFNDDNGIASKQSGNLIPPVLFDQYQTAYALADLRLSYTRDNRPWRIELYSTNVGDQKYLKDAGNTGADIGLPTYIAGEPRFFGVTVSIRR